MRILATLAVLAALLGGAAIYSSADADCRTTCHGNSAGGGGGGNQTCDTHCW